MGSNNAQEEEGLAAQLATNSTPTWECSRLTGMAMVIL